MTARNYALIRNDTVDNIIVLDDTEPFDPSFALWLTQYDQVVEVPTVPTVPGAQGLSPGHRRAPGSGPAGAFAPPPQITLDGQAVLSAVTIAADGKTVHTVTLYNAQTDAPAQVTFTVTQAGTTRTFAVNVAADHTYTRTFAAPSTPTTVVVSAAGLSVVAQAV